jgi:NhaA family Na+:H+ antiporter
MQETNFGDLTFLGGKSVFARFFARPVKRFLAVEAAGGVMLLIATAVALIWVNSPWGDSYDSFWSSPVNLSVNGIEIFEDHSLTDFVNDALMALFFFVVGLEIKRELVDGQLQNINRGGAGEDGWGIPMATDIAFAVGIVSLLGDRIPRRLKVFLLSLAIVDDIGAIIVIALFYSSGISAQWLLASGLLLGFIYGLRRLRVWWIPMYVVLGAIVWWTTFRSGVHATIAGVALGLLTPARPLQNQDETRSIARWLRDKPEVFPVDVRYASFHIRESISVAERLETVLHPITSYMIIPIFALANAGVRIDGGIIADALQSRVTWGIIVFSLVATKLGIAKRPASLTLRTLVGLAMIAGIGFTVSLFVNNLAFGEAEHHDEVALVAEAPGELVHTAADELDSDGSHADDDHSEIESGPVEGASIEDNAKIGILFASVIASIGGLLILSGGRIPEDE